MHLFQHQHLKRKIFGSLFIIIAIIYSIITSTFVFSKSLFPKSFVVAFTLVFITLITLSVLYSLLGYQLLRNRANFYFVSIANGLLTGIHTHILIQTQNIFVIVVLCIHIAFLFFIIQRQHQKTDSEKGR